jgi:hypothetical protein
MIQLISISLTRSVINIFCTCSGIASVVRENKACLVPELAPPIRRLLLQCSQFLFFSAKNYLKIN